MYHPNVPPPCLNVLTQVPEPTGIRPLEVILHTGRTGQYLQIVIQEAIRFLQEEVWRAVRDIHRDHIIHLPTDHHLHHHTAADPAQVAIHQDLQDHLVRLPVPHQDHLVHHREAGGKCDRITACVFRSFSKWNWDVIKKKLTIMKKLSLLFLVLGLVWFEAIAQNTSDALRYSQLFYNGTARFNSMGGAFTALGGDISSLSQNPAGIGVFRSSEFAITPQLYHIKSSAELFTKKSIDYLYDFNLAQAGLVVNLINRDSETGLVTLNFGYSFNRTNNLNQSTVMEGTSNNSSLLDRWAEKSSGLYKDQLENNNDVYDAYLGWSTYLIDSLPGVGNKYGTIYSNYGDGDTIYGQNMKRTITTNGFSGEHSISFGGNYSNKLFFGATLGITRLNFENSFRHVETAVGILPSRYSVAGEGFTDFNYTDYRKSIGTGYSLKIGAIFRPLEILRIGLAFHSPTLYRIDEYTNDNISTWFSDLNQPINAKNDPLTFKYTLTTPFRAIAGVALQIKKIALISADYEFIDYSSSKFATVGDDNFDYTEKNQSIKNDLKPVSNLRFGTEIRLKSIYLRGGYGIYGKPWAKGIINEDLFYKTFAFGFGFREQNIFADFGFSRMTSSEKYTLYDAEIETVVSNLDIAKNMFTVTFGYKFSY